MKPFSLFSTQTQRQQHPVFGSVLLITGCCIGAGMLGLPIVTGIAGFVPSVMIFVMAWAYMMLTALLLVEVNSWELPHAANLITQARRLLGPVGQIIIWITFVFLFYCLLIAYFAKGGELLTNALRDNFSAIPSYFGALILAATAAVLISVGAKSVDRLNALFMIIMIVSFIMLTTSAAKYTDFSLLNHRNWDATGFLIPFLITSFGFHNIIPSLRSYLSYRDRKLKSAVIIGGTVPLVVYLVWTAVILSVIPVDGSLGIINSYQEGRIATEVLGEMTHSHLVGALAVSFAASAIITSILGQGLSVVDFLIDGLKMQGRYRRWLASALTFVPAFVLSQTDPHIFFKALSYVGGFAAIILYGLMPALFVWRGRYVYDLNSSTRSPLNKFGLICLMLAALVVFGLEFAKTFGHLELL